MNKRKKTLLALGMVLALAGIATSSAFIYKKATQEETVALDSALYLDWGDDVTDFKKDPGVMVFGTAKYKSLTVKTPQKSLSVTSGTVDLTFTLGTNDGFKVEVSDKNFQEEGSGANEAILATIEKGGEAGTEGRVEVETTLKFDINEFTRDLTFYFRLSLSHAPEEGQQGLDATFTASLSYDARGVKTHTISADSITVAN